MTEGNVKPIKLVVPARREYMLVVRSALGGAAVIMGLDIDLMDDLRMAADEACDYLMHQPQQISLIEMTLQKVDHKVCTSFAVEWDGQTQGQQGIEMQAAKAILETLIPQVDFEQDEKGIFRITLWLPTQES